MTRLEQRLAALEARAAEFGEQTTGSGGARTAGRGRGGAAAVRDRAEAHRRASSPERAAAQRGPGGGIGQRVWAARTEALAMAVDEPGAGASRLAGGSHGVLGTLSGLVEVDPGFEALSRRRRRRSPPTWPMASSPDVSWTVWPLLGG